MVDIDYSRIIQPRKRQRTDHSIRNSFYLPKSKEMLGRYKAYFEYETFTDGVALQND